MKGGPRPPSMTGTGRNGLEAATIVKSWLDARHPHRGVREAHLEFSVSVLVSFKLLSGYGQLLPVRGQLRLYLFASQQLIAGFVGKGVPTTRPDRIRALPAPHMEEM